MDITTLVTSVVSFIFTSAGKKLIGNATDATLPKIKILRKKIVDKLKSKPNVKQELEKKKDINVEKIKSYLQVEMIEDEKFKEEIEKLITEIKQDLEADG